MIKTPPLFITIEGIEGTGKSTAVKMIIAWLNQKKIAHIATREPGGTPIAETIRQVFLHRNAKGDDAMEKDTELLLAFASRCQHVNHVIKPALAKGQWVICDRFTDASYAYQGGGRQMPETKIATLEQWIHSDLQPNLTLLLDAPVDIAMRRIKGRTQDRIEQENLAFFERIRQVYLDRAKKFPERFRIINTHCTLDDVKTRIQTQLEQLL